MSGDTDYVPNYALVMQEAAANSTEMKEILNDLRKSHPTHLSVCTNCTSVEIVNLAFGQFRFAQASFVQLPQIAESVFLLWFSLATMSKKDHKCARLAVKTSIPNDWFTPPQLDTTIYTTSWKRNVYSTVKDSP